MPVMERGSLDSLDDTSGYLLNSPLSLLHFRNTAWINRLRLQLDAMNYEWQTSIMNYRYEQQATVLRALLGDLSSYRIVLLFCMMVLITVTPLALWIMWKRVFVYRNPMSRRLQRLDRELRRHGVARRPGDTLRQARALLKCQDHEKTAHLESEIRKFEGLYYVPKTQSSRRL